MSGGTTSQPEAELRRNPGLVGLAVACALLAVLPLAPFDLFTPSLRQILISTFLVCFAGFGWNVVSGYLGYLSLGEHLFFGIGAYVTVYFTSTYELSPLLSLPIAFFLCAAITSGTTLLVTRLSFRGLYYALVTLAVAEIGRILLSDVEAFGRYAGMYLPPENRAGHLLFISTTSHYYLNLGLLAGGGVLAWVIFRSKAGLEMRALHSDEVAARTLGIPLRRRLWQASTISAFYFSIAGMVYSFELFFVRPSTTLPISIVVDVLIMVMIGGLGRVWGPLVGMFVIAALRYGVSLMEFSTTTSAQIAVIAQACVLIAVVALRKKSSISSVVSQLLTSKARKERTPSWTPRP